MDGRSHSRASWIPTTAPARLLSALVAGLLGAAAGWLFDGGAAPAVSGAVAAAGVVFVVMGWVALTPMDSVATRNNVNREDFRPSVDELIVVGVAVAALGGIIALLVVGGTDASSLHALLAVIGVFMAWAALHMMYATRYAFMYYAKHGGEGIDFNSKVEQPGFSDFFYFSYTLGMTYAVSDTNVTSSEIRSVVLRHTLLSYVFGVAIVATTINLVAGALIG